MATNYARLEEGQNESQDKCCEQNNNVTTNLSGPTPTEAELTQIKRSTRWVHFLSIVQLLIGIVNLISGGFFIGILMIVFSSMGISGASRRQPRTLVAHFAFSLILYIFTLIGLVFMIVYCDECNFFMFLIGFLFLILQAVGMRHSRILIGFAKIYGPVKCSRRGSRCNANNNQNFVEVTPQQQQQPIAVQPTYPQFVQLPHPYMQVPPYPVVNNNNINGQPMMMVRYPMLQPTMVPQPMPYVPTYNQIQQAQPQQQEEQQQPLQPQPFQPQQPPMMYPYVPGVYRQV